jgi:hypothetical protein
MKNHAKKFLEKMSEHHLRLSKTHAGLSEHFHGLHKSRSADDHFDQIAAHHQVASDYHKEMAEHAENFAKAIEEAVDTSVPTNSNSFGGHQFSAAALADELAKKWGLRPGVEAIPSGLSAVAPSNESLRRTSRLVGRDGVELDSRTGEALEKSAKETVADSPLAHWFE